MQHLRRHGAGYLVAILATVAAVLLRLTLNPWIGTSVPFSTMYAAIALAVWYGGYRSGLLAAVLGYLASNYFFMQPRGSFAIQNFSDHVILGLYLLTCAVIIGLGEAARLARHRAQEGRDRLHTTLASIGDAVIATDTEGRITMMNAVGESLTLWKQEQATGQPLDAVFRIVNEQTRKAVENPVTRALREGIIVGLANHTVLIAKDGTERPIDDSAAPIRDGYGRVVGCVLVFRDVTERRKAERAARFLASIVESSDDAIIGKDVNGVITSWNRAAERLFGYSAAEAIGSPIKILAPPDHADEMSGILTRIKQGERVEHFDTIRRAKDGRLVPISLTVSPIKDGEGVIVGASKVARDVSERKRAEEALREEKARLHTTLVGIGDAVIVTDAESHVTIMNPVAQALTGWKGEATGRPLEEVFRIVNEQTRRPVESPVSRVFREGTVVGLANHTVLISKDGAERPIDDSAAPIRDQNGLLVGVVMVFRDVTERRKAEQERIESEERIRSVLNHVLDGIIAIDEQGRIEAFNAAAENLFGYKAQEVIGQNVKVLMPEPFHGEHDGYLANYRRTGQAKIIGIGREVVGRRKDGSTFPMDLAVSTFELDRKRHFTGIVRDITERKQAEEALKSADRRKDEFLATLAHELRNPLAPLRNSLQLMRIPGTDPAAAQQALDTMERQVDQLVRLVDDLLDAARISRGKIELRKERLELSDAVHKATEICRPLAENLEHVVDVSLPREPVYLDADPVRLAQVFSNLLNNACKYTEPGGRIWLTAERQGSDVLVSVKDSGIGIPHDMLPRIFEMFTQVDQSLERSQGGLGIGLTLVKQLVEMHEGTVEASSEGPGLGSEFVVRLPLAAEKQAASNPTTPTASKQATTARRILVVDDNKDSADSLARLLRISGHETRLAYDGLEGVHAAQEFRPEIVMLDIGMPELNGFDACRRIREQAWGQMMVLVALTGWGQEEDRRKSKEAGFDHHLVKPVDFNALLKLLSELRPATA